MKKFLFLSLMVISIVSFLNISFVDAKDSYTKITFPLSISTGTFIQSMKKYDIPLKELYFQEGNIQGGYTLQTGESVESAISNFTKHHEKFLNDILKDFESELKKEGISDNEKQQIRKDQLSLKKMQSDFYAGRFKIHGFESTDIEKSEKIANDIGVKIILPSTSTQSLAPVYTISSITKESWAPYKGTTEIDQKHTYQSFYFNNISDFGSNSTYEHETQVYNKNYADYDNYWASSMPSAYYDTPFLDQIDNFTVGTAQASLLQKETKYFTYMALRAGTATTATVRTKGQKGHRTPSSCYSTWCIFADATTGSLSYFTALPAGISWTY